MTLPRLLLIQAFFSALLLFQIQPIISKIVLPWFGGGAGVWTTCLFFFQFVLFLGYLYSYGISKLKNIHTQYFTHCVLLVVSTLVLIADINSLQYITSHYPHSIGVIILLASSIGVPFFCLSASTPLLQIWSSKNDSKQYTFYFYAVSNAGSLLGLIIYPFLIEPFIPLDIQKLIWKYAFLVFSITFVFMIYKLVKLAPETAIKSTHNRTKESDFISLKTKSIWFLLSLVGVVLLVSITQAISQNLPPIPFIWITPLVVYLCSFIFVFNKDKMYQKWFWLGLYIPLSLIFIFIFFIAGQLDIVSQLVCYLMLLLCGCVICHGELHTLRPKHSDTTLFYLVMSAGGVTGTFLITFVAEHIFDNFFELPIAVVSVLVLFVVCDFISTSNSNKNKRFGIKSLASKILPISVFAIFWLLAFLEINKDYEQYNVAQHRNFYGILAVKEIRENGVNEKRLSDGNTSHGSQSLTKGNELTPLNYYSKDTGVGHLFEFLNEPKSLKIGIIGLGAGGLSVYGREIDTIKFYELNPAVLTFAQTHFSFLKKSESEINVEIGDARINLQKEYLSQGSANYDVFVLDAFSGDQIPTHLLTFEAFELYNKHVSLENGVIAVHISNRYLNLASVIEQHASKLGMMTIHTVNQNNGIEFGAEWVILTRDNSLSEYFKNHPNLISNSEILSGQPRWTDNYSSVLSVLKL
ncbi:hypothetical protein D5R81_00475 [Parashewanella spongiae]|uniref:Ferrichrome ABC transporter permease n=1 Tax=Parashewanella spongiae TaxID=342950 RepID=A0A3A6TY69_9GAMM|nr:hypothetical protein [Parashewanella spongiae]MCL1076714.1 hypothetical protein [Parashewanella spongiae]RJY19459.1 hypothetical protein D5R81_00475 [Parashewanella spongiae]